MMIIVGSTILAVIVTTAIWLWSMRTVDRISLIMSTTARTGVMRYIMKRPTLCDVTASNGFKTTVPGDIMKHAMEAAFELKMRSDDVIVASFAKAGTTWMQEIVWLICNDANVKAAKQTALVKRFGFLESPDIKGINVGVQSLEKWPRDQRRFIKTHMPFELLPDGLQKGPVGKMVCVVRNPKDNCVSFYHFHRAIAGLPEPGTWSEFLTKFCRGEVAFGSWFDHVSKYWQVYQERKDSVYFVSYECLKRDLKGEIKTLAKFLGKNLSEEQIDIITEHCTFNSMSKNDSVNYTEANKYGFMDFKTSKFMRKGEVGDWKNYFTINQNVAFDDMYEEKTRDWTLKFEFEPAS